MAAPGKALSARDKEKLKEKLASLQREYRKTFSRLQRAERAERVKSYVKKTVAEQNDLLLHAAAEEGPADPTGQVAPEASESILAGSCPETNAVKTPSVTFSLEPEVFTQECHVPEDLGSDCTSADSEKVLGGTGQPLPEKKPSRLSRSRRRGRPSEASQERRDFACGGDKPQHKGGGLEDPPSPVFKGHCSSFEAERDESISGTPSAITPQGGSSPRAPVTPRLEDSQGAPGAKVTPGLLSPPPGCFSEKNWGPSLEHSGQGDTLASPEGSAGEDSVLLAGVQSVSKEKERDAEDGGGLCRRAPRERGRAAPQGRGPFGEPRSHSRDSPTLRPGGEGEAASRLPEEAPPATPPSSLLDSCTVVEGLLFPVEYYVRTTRRMSSCQREPNLAAVIQSQLGWRRRSQRAFPKHGAPSPAPAPQALPASPPQAGQGGGSGSPLVSKESPGPGEGTPPCRSLTQRRGRRKGRGRPRARAPSHGTQGLSASVGLQEDSYPTPSEACRSEPPDQAADGGCARAEPAQGATVSFRHSGTSGSTLKRQAGGTSPGGRGSRSCPGAPGSPSPSCPDIPPHSLRWLPPDLPLQEFHLPAEEFGLLQAEKVKASATAGLEIVGGGQTVKPPRAAEERPGDLLHSPEDPPSEPSPLQMSKLLLSPTNAVLEEESQLPTPLFPMVGATPAIQDFRGTPRQAPATSPSARAEGKPACGTEVERCPAGMLCPEDKGGAYCRRDDEASVSSEARQELAAESGELFRGSAEQRDVAAAEGLAEAPWRCPGEGRLQLTSKLQSSTGSCCVDVSAVWWETADFTELCIVTACETSVTLWRRLGSGCWGSLHTWSFAEVPVLQLVPLPGAQDYVCVALGALEIAELRLLFYPLQDGGLKQALVKAGTIRAVLGLSGRRLVSSCSGAVEVLAFPDAGGSCTGQALFPPEETTLAFAAVEGMPEALVGLTAANCVAVWNLSTRQLLCQMPLGYAYPAPVCHQAYSDSGLLFVVLSHPCAKANDLCGSPAFQVVAFNPKTGRSAKLMVVSLPPGLQGRYLEGAVRETSAAAVLTSGELAVWDLLGGECTALLPPSAQGRWSLVRWSVTDKCLLAGRTDGSVCTYLYAARPGSAPERAERDGGSAGSEPLPQRDCLPPRDCWGLAQGASGPPGPPS